ncbi:receptor-type tyrosine-protein phosphatase epsilon-like [Discoglossus pictus]
MAENTITWRSLPDNMGIITGYQMNISAWRDYNSSFTYEESHWFGPDVTEYKIQLTYGSNYTLTLRGFTSAGAGEAATWTGETPIAEPLLLQNNITVRQTDAVLHLHHVSDLHGPISYYEIIIYSGRNRNTSTEYMQCSATYNNSTTNSSVYIAALLPAYNVSRPMTLTLGDGQHYGGYFNAPLNHDHNYTVYVRVTSTWKEEKKSSCSLVKLFQVSGPPRGGSELVAGSLAAVAVLLVLVILLVLWKWGVFRSAKCGAGKSNNQSDIPMSTKSGPGKKKKDIPVEELLGVIQNFRRVELAATEEAEDVENSNMLPVGRHNEYQELPSGLLYPCEVATAAENKSKNRYKKVIPYDANRVILNSSPSGSDYINASYIDGYKSPKFFIATQGPLPETLADFWCMVWEQNSSVIVMLTSLEEQNKVKCECYWPEEVQTYGDITVSLETVAQTGAIVTRSFSLMKEGSTVQKEVQQLHYLQWPDHGVPNKPTGLVLVVKQMNQFKLPGSGPVIVHCSAGIGRTGTLIAFDVLLKMARAVKKVNVYNCTLQIRKKRVSMVQNQKQYLFLYDILLETLLCGDTSVQVQDIHKHVNQMALKDHVAQQKGCEDEYKAVEKLSGLYRIYTCKEGQKPENESKNHNPYILPDDHCRPILMSRTDGQGNPGYINAVFVDSNSLKDVLIITQLPVKDTLADFWSLIWDYKCTSVIMMHGAEDLAQIALKFWPEKGETRYHDFSVKKISKGSAPGYTGTTLSLRNRNESPNSSLEVKLWQLDCWPQGHPVPNNPSALISLIGEAEKRRQKNTDSHILVTCCDGASRSGLFCAGTVICDQIRSDGCLDVSQAVRGLKRRRVQLIPTIDQYSFCYVLAQSYLDSFETYGNFK